ncbi:MAG: thioredoxin domain-containing protein [Polyangiaceae bacterium]|nr:thioredoxin domain-containing protein [Polyangiaceae bacterium]
MTAPCYRFGLMGSIEPSPLRPSENAASASKGEGISPARQVEVQRPHPAAREILVRLWLGPTDRTAMVCRLEESARFALGATDLARPRLLSGVGVATLTFDTGGPNLAELLAARTLTPSRLAAMLSRAAAALQHLHDQGIAHGHLCPEFLCEGSPAVAGFGTAALVDAAADPPTTLLAVPLRAPELGKRPPSPESDVFALGALLREVATVWRDPSADPAWTTAAAKIGRWSAMATAERGVDRPAVTSLEGLSNDLVAVEEPSPTVEDPGGSPPAERRSAPEVEGPLGPGLSAPPAAPTNPGRAVRWATSVGAPPCPREREPAEVKTRGHHPAVALTVTFGVVLMLAAPLGAFVANRWDGPRTPPSLAASSSGSPVESTLVPPAASGNEVELAPPTPTVSVAGAGAAAPLALGDLLVPTSPSALPGMHTTAVMPIDPTSPALGNAEALVTVVVFADPSAPPTPLGLELLQRLAAKLTDVRLVYRHNPQDTVGARAARVAVGIRHERGDAPYWRFLAAAARVGGLGTQDALLAAAATVGAEESAVERWLHAPEPQAQVERDRSLAVLFAVRTVPTLFVNGRRVPGELPVARFEALLREEQRKGAVRVADGLPSAEVYPERAAFNLVRLGRDVELARCPSIAGAPWRGAEQPLVTVVEIGDFECALCAKVAPALDRLVRDHADLRHVFLDFPLTQHPHARMAATFAHAVQAAHGAEAFFRLAANLRAANGPLDDGALRAAADALGYDGEALLTAARGDHHTRAIEERIAAVRRVGVRAIPTLYVNGRRLDGVGDPGDLAAAIEQERRRAQRLIARGSSAARAYELLCGTE